MRSTDAAASSRRSGLLNVADIIVAPNAAFDRLRANPSWGWAFVVASLLGIAGMLLAQPAFMHALEVSGPALYAASPAVAKLPPDKQKAMIDQMIQVGRVSTQLQWIAIPLVILIGGLVSSVVMLIANAVGKGDGSFKKFFALSITTAVVNVGLGTLILGVITQVRGADSFDSSAAITRALPGLAMLAPGAPAKAVAFLSAFSVFTIWSTALNALGMIRMAHIPPAIAWIFATAMLVVTALIAASFTP